MVQEGVLHSGEILRLITHDDVTDLLPAQPQKYSDSPKEPMSSNTFLYHSNPANDRNRSPPGTRCNKREQSCCLELSWQPTPHSPALTRDSTQQLSSLKKWGKTPQIVLRLPRLKSSWDNGYFWQFVFKYAMLQSQLSKCKLHCGCPF